MFEDKFSASVDGGATVAGLVGLKVGLQGEGSSEVHSNIGTLHKQEVNMATLVRESYNKYLEKGHPLLRQLEVWDWKRTLGFVSARVFNRNEFFISKQEEQGASSKANVNIQKVSIDHSGSFGKENKVKLRVPANTTLAYRFMKLKINDVQPIIRPVFRVCRSIGSGMAESTFPKPESVITMEVLDPEATARDETLLEPFCSLALRELARQLSPLGEESVDTRTTLLQLLTDIMVDQEVLHTLEMAVDNVNMGLTPDVESVEQEALKTQITSVLQLLPRSTSYHPLPYAIHLLITALTAV
ncbi:uncharacterized protein LOC134449820 [Engraulis encrasicolus]|uniref:uncharacterized protein LOC134449820 n=1 Tax=Engraulis encrasicolus TaxID=184585 RepID=UPI002FD1719A